MKTIFSLVWILFGTSALLFAEKEEKWVSDLNSKEAVVWREAQIQLAREGKEALPKLVALLEKAEPSLKERIREVISIMLLKAVAYPDFQNHSALVELCKKEIEHSLKTVKILEEVKYYDSGEQGLGPPGAPPAPKSPERQAFLDAVKLQGFAVPAAFHLIAQKSPFARYYGIQILFRAEAYAQADSLGFLKKDQGTVSVSHGCYDVTESISKSVQNWITQLEGQKNHKIAVALDAEKYLEVALSFQPGYQKNYRAINELRSKAKTAESKSWEDYWERARPHLKNYFKSETNTDSDTEKK